MHIELARNRAILANPQESESHKNAARSALESIAADPSDRRQQDAAFVLRELGLTGEQSRTETVQTPDSPKQGPLDWIPTSYTEDLPTFLATYRSTINNPSASAPEKAAAWKVVNDPETELNRIVDGLESELLAQAARLHISTIEHGAIHEFCTAKGWTKIPTRLLYFDRWLPAYFATDHGSRKLAELETYKMMHDTDGRKEKPDKAKIALFTEIRRRIRTDAQFRKMLAEGVGKGELSLDYVKGLTADIWQDTPEVIAK